MYPLSVLVVASVVAGVVAGIIVLFLAPLLEGKRIRWASWYYSWQVRKANKQDAKYERQRPIQQLPPMQQRLGPGPPHTPRASPLAHTAPDKLEPEDEEERDHSRREKRTFWS